jgi:hypothetical protein
MEKTLRQLETFRMRGSDGKSYAVHAYEHLARVDLTHDAFDHWEPTGQVEYKLADGRPVTVDGEGVMHVAGSDLRLMQ